MEWKTVSNVLSADFVSRNDSWRFAFMKHKTLFDTNKETPMQNQKRPADRVRRTSVRKLTK